MNRANLLYMYINALHNKEKSTGNVLDTRAEN